MKKIILWLLLTMFLFSLCGCNQPASQYFETVEPLPDSSSNKKQDTADSPKTIVFESVENDSRSTVYFYDQDFSALPLQKPTTYEANYAPSPACYSELVNKLTEENGIIVAGYAYGLREGYRSNGRTPKTLTTFKVEQVYFGNLEKDTIVISENYYPVSENGKEYIEYDNAKTMLKDHRKSLLFLIPSHTADVYWPCYGAFPLPNDYQEFTDADRKELFDYYRGDLSVFNMELAQPKEAYTETVNNPDGSISIIQYEAFDNFWPVRKLSDEALMEELNENVLLQMVSKYNIKIWPYYHIRYSCQSLPFDGALERDSLPQ